VKKRRATEEHDFTLLQQVRQKHVSLGEADAVRVQQKMRKASMKAENKDEEPQSIEYQIRPSKYSENLSERTTLEQQSILPEESLTSEINTKVSFSVLFSY
jgi:hypothetical protein